MAEQRDVAAIIGNPKTSAEIFSTLTRAEKKARVAVVLDRGITNDRLHIPDMPKHLHYEFHPNDPGELARLSAAGFWVPTAKELGITDRSLHGDGSNAIIVGDSVCVVCLKEDYEIIEEVRQERFKKANGDPSLRRRTAQAGDMPEGESAEQDKVIRSSPTITESVEQTIDANELSSQLLAAQKAAAAAAQKAKT